MKITTTCGAALALSSLPVLALAAGPQTPAYGIGDAMHEAQTPKPPVDKPADLPVLPRAADDAPFLLPDGKTVFVKDFTLDGTEGLDSDLLEQVGTALAPYRGRDLDMKEIYEAAAAVTNLLRAQGFLLAKVYVPRQAAGDGQLLLKLVVGRFGAVTLDNGTVIHDFMVDGVFADTVESGRPVTKADLERAMLLAADLAGAKMPKVTISPGAQPGTSDFLIKAEPANRLVGYLLTDNYGSRYTGRNRMHAGASANSPFGLGDRLSISAMTAEGAGLQNGRAAYSVPLSYSGLRLELAASQVSYKLGDVYRALDATGTATTWGGTLSFPVLRGVDENLVVSASAQTKRLQDQMAGETIASKHAYVGTANVENTTRGSLWGLTATTEAVAGLTLGKLVFADGAQKAANLAGANTEGTYSHLNLSVGGSVLVTPDLSLGVTAKGQRTLMDKNLDASEQMSISGVDGVKSYVEGVTGDNGYLLNVEARYALPSFGDFSHAIGLFSDLGRVYVQNNDYSATQNAIRLNDVGLAYYTNFQYDDDRYLVGKLLVTQSIGPDQDTGEKNARTKLLAQLGLTF